MTVVAEVKKVAEMTERPDMARLAEARPRVRSGTQQTGIRQEARRHLRCAAWRMSRREPRPSRHKHLTPNRRICSRCVKGNSMDEDDFLWRTPDLARYLQMNEGTIHNWLSQGCITDADGRVRIGTKQIRYITRVVKVRIEAGLFGRGLDADGNPVKRRWLRVA
jgi:hypothetical protein